MHMRGADRKPRARRSKAIQAVESALHTAVHKLPEACFSVEKELPSELLNAILTDAHYIWDEDAFRHSVIALPAAYNVLFPDEDEVARTSDFSLWTSYAEDDFEYNILQYGGTAADLALGFPELRDQIPNIESDKAYSGLVRIVNSNRKTDQRVDAARYLCILFPARTSEWIEPVLVRGFKEGLAGARKEGNWLFFMKIAATLSLLLPASTHRDRGIQNSDWLQLRAALDEEKENYLSEADLSTKAGHGIYYLEQLADFAIVAADQAIVSESGIELVNEPAPSSSQELPGRSLV